MKNEYIIEKSNSLNTLMSNDITLTELRFFCMYLSKINARNPESRIVEIPISEFEDLFNIKLNTTLFTRKIEKIAGRTIKVKEDGRIKILTLYSEFSWIESQSTTLRIICNDKILPYIFELQKNYTSYVIGNISKLNSVQKIRLYEVGKQYEKMGNFEIPLEELKLMIGSNLNADFRHFRTDTLAPAIEDINKYTDLNITYEKILKNRKVIALKFTIKGEKKKFKGIAVAKTEAKELPKASKKDSISNINDSFTELYNRYFKDRNFKKSDTETIIIKLTEKVNSSGAKVKQIEEIEIYLKNLMTVYDKQRGKKTLENKVGYILGMIEKSAFIKQEPEYRQREEQSYDINEFEKYAINYEEFKKVEEQSEDVQRNSDAEEITVSESNFKAETVQQFFERVGYKG